MLEFVRVEVGEGSPPGCSRCAPAVPATYHDLDRLAEDIAHAVRTPSGSVAQGLLLSGPDPFSHPALPAVVEACVSTGVPRIGIETAGTALSVHGNAAGVLAAGVRHLFVRVLSGDAATHDGLVGRPGALSGALAGIATYRAAAVEAGVPCVVTGVVPVCRHVRDALPLTVAALARAGVDAVRLVEGRDPGGQAAAAIAAACDTGMVNRVWVEVSPALPLPASHALHVLDPGVSDG